jgi:hypothetical protein
LHRSLNGLITRNDVHTRTRPHKCSTHETRHSQIHRPFRVLGGECARVDDDDAIGRRRHHAVQVVVAERHVDALARMKIGAAMIDVAKLVRDHTTDTSHTQCTYLCC